jgi:hypothetical protein
MTNQTTTTQLSPRAKENLQKNAEIRRRDSKFVKMQSGEKRVFQFDPERIEQVEAEFNGKKSIRFRYAVKEDGTDTEQYFEVSKRTSEDIDSFLMEGITRLKIQRSGSGTDTRYLIMPV